MASTDQFAHLHVHSDHSVLDGAAAIERIVKAAAADGAPGVSLTDHGTMSGAVDLLTECKKANIVGAIGNELYVAIGPRPERNTIAAAGDDTDPDDSGAGKTKTKRYYHLTALAESTVGYHNLIKISSRASFDGFWGKPRADHELLAEHGEGLIFLTGCLGGEVAHNLLNGNYKGACEVVDRMRGAAGRDSVYVEVMDHGIPAQRKIIPDLYRLADDMGVSTVVTNDSHYVGREHAHGHDAWLAVQTGCTLHDDKRFRFHGDGHYVKTAAEMRGIADDDHWRRGCNATLEIIERIKAGGGNDIIPRTAALPKVKIPDEWNTGRYDHDVAKYLQHLVAEGAKARYGNPLPDHVKTRLRFEFDTIVNMGYAAYFLIVWELVNWARQNRIRVGPGRGSAAGCAISYCLGIVAVDPIGNDLLFERFLNPDRVSMPDIDMDFEDRHRDTVIDHLRDVYGAESVAQLGTFGGVGARGAVKDAARVLSLPANFANELTALMPPLYMGRDVPLRACLGIDGQTPHPGAADLRGRYSSDAKVRECLDLAVQFEGLIRSEGRHASAVVITDGPVIDHLPARQQWKAQPDGTYEKDGPIVTSYDGATVEGLGFLKLDVLGLKNLTIIERTLDHIEARTGTRPELETVTDDPNDPQAARAWNLLQAGQSIGVFQFESPPMQDILRRATPGNRTDLAALNALYRPGAMRYIDPFVARRHGREKVSYDQWTRDPKAVEALDRILGPTFGFPLFQEQAMQLAKDLAGFTPGESDELRKAIGKKVWAKMNALEPKWVEGIVVRFGDEKFARSLWDAVKASADYSFNKSHSLCYGGYLAWDTAWLKANYPVEYMAAWIECADKPVRRAELYAECRAMGIGLLNPDINLSAAWPYPDSSGKIRLGFSTISSMDAIVDQIVAERDRGGPFTSLADVCVRLPQLKRANLDVLTKAGCFDSFGPRLGTMIVIDAMKSLIKSGRTDLLAELPIPPVEMTPVDRLKFEMTSLRATVSDSLVSYALPAIREAGALSFAAWLEAKHQQKVRVGGVLVSAEVQQSKAGNWFGRFSLDVGPTVVPVIVFSRTLEAIASRLKVALSNKMGDLLAGLPVLIDGRCQIDVPENGESDGEERREVIANDVTLLEYSPVAATAEDESVVRELSVADVTAAPVSQPPPPPTGISGPMPPVSGPPLPATLPELPDCPLPQSVPADQAAISTTELEAATNLEAAPVAQRSMLVYPVRNTPPEIGDPDLSRKMLMKMRGYGKLKAAKAVEPGGSRVIVFIEWLPYRGESEDRVEAATERMRSLYELLGVPFTVVATPHLGVPFEVAREIERRLFKSS